MHFSIPNILMGLLGMALGIWITKEAYHIQHHILYFGWAEQKFGPGYGTIAYRWVGLAITIFSMFVALGYIDLVGAAFGGGGGKASGSKTPLQQDPSGAGVQIAP